MSPHTLSVQCTVNAHFTLLSAGLFLCLWLSHLSRDTVTFPTPSVTCDCCTFECWSILLHTCVHLLFFGFFNLERKTLSSVSPDFSYCRHENSWSPTFARRLWRQRAQICWGHSSCFEKFGPSDQHSWTAFSIYPALLSSFQQDPGASSRPWISA